MAVPSDEKSWKKNTKIDENVVKSTVSRCLGGIITLIEQNYQTAHDSDDLGYGGVDHSRRRLNGGRKNIYGNSHGNNIRKGNGSDERFIAANYKTLLSAKEHVFSKHYTPMAIKGMLCFLLELDENSFFMDPVPTTFVDYYQKVKKPICFDYIRKKVTSIQFQYRTIEQFESDDQPKAFVKGGTQTTASRAEARGEAHAPPGPSARGPPPSLKPAAPVPRESGRPSQQRVPSAATRSMFSQDDGELELCPVPVQRPCPRGAPFARGPRRC